MQAMSCPAGRSCPAFILVTAAPNGAPPGARSVGATGQATAQPASGIPGPQSPCPVPQALRAGWPAMSRGKPPARGVGYRFARVKLDRFFGAGTLWFGKPRVTVIDLERALLHGLCTPQHFGHFAEVRSRPSD